MPERAGLLLAMKAVASMRAIGTARAATSTTTITGIRSTKFATMDAFMNMKITAMGMATITTTTDTGISKGL